MILNKAYYLLKPIIPWQVRVALRQARARRRRAAYANVWPIDEKAAAVPQNWPGWPGGKRFAFVLTHDVEWQKGLDRIDKVARLEAKYGFRSSFNLIPEREYRVPEELPRKLHEDGFEVGVHGLKHDGKLFSSKSEFAARAAKIRQYARKWGASGFRAPLMQHKLDWLHLLGTEYDASTFDTDPFEPESDGYRTIFPFWTSGPDGAGGYVELPYTLVQDFTLFVILGEKNIDIWKQKLDWIAERGGMALLNTHPDYMSFEGKQQRDEFPVAYYEEFLRYAQTKYEDAYWHALPREVSHHYKSTLQPALRNSRKRICMVVHSTYDFDTRVRRYCETLAKRGDLVDVVATSNDNVPIGEADVNGVRVFRIQRRENGEHGKWAYIWPLLRFLFKSSRLVSNRHKEVRYDLVHIHNMPDFLVFAAWYPKLTGAKVILDIHDLVPELFADKFKGSLAKIYVGLLKKVERLSAAFTDHVIVANHIWEKTLIARTVPKERCSVFLNNIDSELFYRRKRTRTDSRFIIVFPGTWQWHQGLDVAIGALAYLRERAPKAELHLYGGGGGANMVARLTEQAESLGVKDMLKFCGDVSLDCIAEVMANADVGIVPKRADSFGNEAYSTKILEYMSQGLPVVASRTKIDTFYFDETEIRFFPSGDSRAMAEAIIEVKENAALRESLIRKGLECARLNAWERKQGDYFSLIDDLTAERFADVEAPGDQGKVKQPVLPPDRA